MEIDYKSIENLVRAAGKKMLQANLTNNMIHHKEGIANYCTDYDLEIQKFLFSGLSKVVPEAAFFGEEDIEGNSRADKMEEYVFFIDPIDGTTNFMFHYNHSCVSVGLAYKMQMEAGWVYNPFVDEMYMGIRGKGSFLNGKRLHIEDKPISQGIVAFGCARYNENDTDLLFDIVKDLYLNSLSVRNGGSAALDLCRVASESNVAYLELKLQPYDYAAASLIIEEAGGRITQADGNEITLDLPCSIVAGTKTANQEIRKRLAVTYGKTDSGMLASQES